MENVFILALAFSIL